MTPAQLSEVPRDLGSMQYSAWLCENRLAIPANRSNMEVISQAIDSLSKAKFRDKPRPIFTAFIWLERQCEFAQQAAIATNHLFFLNGDYNSVAAPEKKLPEFTACNKDGCVEGWKSVTPEGKDRKVKRCECFAAWKASLK